MNPLTRSDHLFGPLFSDADTEDLWSTQRFIREFTQFESALAGALADVGVVSRDVADKAMTDIGTFSPDLAEIRKQVSVDGLPVPDFVRQLKAHVSAEALPAIHKGATSQDLIDTSVSLILRDVSERLTEGLVAVCLALEALDRQWGETPMMGRTRMQAALPITVHDRLVTWLMPLQSHLAQLPKLRPRVEILQFGGPVGNRAGLGNNGNAVAAALARRLNLAEEARAWHVTRSNLGDYANWLSSVTASLGKMGQDLALMAQQGVNEVRFSGGGTSSAMPHKLNPVLAETLVSLARFNATQMSLIHGAMIHEQERSGIAWTTEWMTLPAMVTASTIALKHASSVLQNIESLGSRPD
ncbi:3-carboxy-cis,cis-muconate cycloisomerase [Shimia sp. SK013]|uniref:3-carboxy-cis,cis-muconate cycloisomerase n=1 Tax=Shimia sp. SK013 TaxID=1389006 RepID=UPI0006B5E721|nr:3-carboxy-cis,cis-muconate cycloisomerase [Shimia sp. SK013]KPA20736.1 3-carboxy-cis,cis-muconate cycloisomerase [Shimia sp. SK013]